MDKLHNASTERFFQVILGLETVEECYRFFEDICTIKEIQDITQRLDVALMLDEGYNYKTISSDVGASTATISRVNKCLQYGSGGYEAAIKKIKAQKGAAQ